MKSYTSDRIKIPPGLWEGIQQWDFRPCRGTQSGIAAHRHY